VPATFDAIVRAAADVVANDGEELDEKRSLVGFGVRQDRLHDLAREPVKSDGGERLRPAVVEGLPGRLRLGLAERDDTEVSDRLLAVRRSGGVACAPVRREQLDLAGVSPYYPHNAHEIVVL